MPDAKPSVLLSTEAIQTRIREMACEIERDYAGMEDLHLVCVLKGAFLFLGDLIRNLDRPVTIDFMAVSSYAKGTTSSGEVRLAKDLDHGLQGRNVIIVEDIVDTGLTLAYLQEILHARSPRSLRPRPPAVRAQGVAVIHDLVSPTEHVPRQATEFLVQCHLIIKGRGLSGLIDSCPASCKRPSCLRPLSQ